MRNDTRYAPTIEVPCSHWVTETNTELCHKQSFVVIWNLAVGKYLLGGCISLGSDIGVRSFIFKIFAAIISKTRNKHWALFLLSFFCFNRLVLDVIDRAMDVKFNGRKCKAIFRYVLDQQPNLWVVQIGVNLVSIHMI